MLKDSITNKVTGTRSGTGIIQKNRLSNDSKCLLPKKYPY
jgi:hypothetical protein